MIKDYYKTLGLQLSATPSEIKRKFRILAKKYHPDLNPNPGAANMFIEVEEAYTCLSDPEKKRAYDYIRKYGKNAARRTVNKSKTKTRATNKTRVRQDLRKTRARARAHARMSYWEYQRSQKPKVTLLPPKSLLIYSLLFGIPLLTLIIIFTYLKNLYTLPFLVILTLAFIAWVITSLKHYNEEQRKIKEWEYINRD